MVQPVPAGLCASCRWVRRVDAARSTFVLCERGLTDPAFSKYPVLPVFACRGHEAAVTEPREVEVES